MFVNKGIFVCVRSSWQCTATGETGGTGHSAQQPAVDSSNISDCATTLLPSMAETTVVARGLKHRAVEKPCVQVWFELLINLCLPHVFLPLSLALSLSHSPSLPPSTSLSTSQLLFVQRLSFYLSTLVSVFPSPLLCTNQDAFDSVVVSVHEKHARKDHSMNCDPVPTEMIM